MAAYKVRPIAGEEIDGAFVLARLAEPGLDIDAWRELCDRLRDDGISEVAVATNRLGYLQGLAISRAVAGSTLDVPSFVAVSAADQPGVGLDLYEHLRARARQLGCRSINIRVAGREPTRLAVDADEGVLRALLTIASER